MRLMLPLLFTVAILIALIAQTAQASDLRLERIGPDLEHPWGMDFVNNHTVLITERGGRLVRLNLQTGNMTEMTGVPRVRARGQGGLLDVMVSSDRTVWLCYAKPGDTGGSATALGHGQLTPFGLERFGDVFIARPWINSRIHFGCRLGERPDGTIVMTLGDRGDRMNSQDPSVHPGSVIRLNPDGSVPANNPYSDGRNWLPELFSIGNRNPQGLAIHARTGDVWIHEHGPQGGDEINIVRGGENFGWPVVSFGEEYGGGDIGMGTSAPGYADPVHHWTPSIAPSGMAFYEGEMFPEFNGDLLVGALKFEMLVHVKLADNRIMGEQNLIREQIGRIRDVAVAADGAILILTDEDDGGLWRLSR